MEDITPETVIADRRRENFRIDQERVTVKEYFEHQKETLSRYIQNNSRGNNIKLFSTLALLNAYVPNSYLNMSECQQILGPPDPTHGGPRFEKRMEPFTAFIKTFQQKSGQKCMIHPKLAQTAVELLAATGISRSDTVKRLFPLCSKNAPPHIVQFIKHLLTKREMGKGDKDKFSRFIEDVVEHESFDKALHVLKSASDKFQWNFIFPQAISRLYYIKMRPSDYDSAEWWAKEAIERDPANSYVADTLGQIYKNRLLRQAKTPQDIKNMAEIAFEAFKEVEMKAERESSVPVGMDTTGTMAISQSFNNRGRFGFMQVAKITFEKPCALQQRDLIQTKKMEVEDNFEFFEWYLTYSKLDMRAFEPSFFWRDVAVCYKHYTNKSAAESTSFPGLLDFLNHGLFMSKGRRAQFEENEKTVADLEQTKADLETAYEGNDDVKKAERYILSNIILSNRNADSSQLTPVRDLQTIIQRFLGTDEKYRDPEFCLLVLLLFWPEEEVDQQVTENNTPLEDEDTDDGHQTSEEHPQLLIDPSKYPDLQQYVQYMENTFQRTKYGKYLRNRYLLPLFFLGKGSGLSKWIHKSRLDAIVERIVNKQSQGYKKKEGRISSMWKTGKVWQIPEIQNMLLPVRVEPCPSPPMSQEHKVREMFVYAGGKQIKASVEVNDPPVVKPMFFYLGFNIRGPVLFKVGTSSI